MLPEQRRLAAVSPALALLLLSGFGCRGEAGARRCAEDRATIDSLLQPDQNASELLRQADALAVQRRADDAARLVDTQVISVCDRAVARAGVLQLQSRWGRARASEAVGLLEERKRSAHAYADALRSGDAERVLDQMQAQKLVEQRALTVRRAVELAPQAAECEP